MFNNIGKKIKILTKISCWIGIVLFVIVGIVTWVYIANEMYDFWMGALLFILISIVGSFFSWIGSFCIYGFGELIEKTCEIAENTYGNEIKSGIQKKSDIERKKKLEKLREQNLITEEEYKGVLLKEE